MLVMVPGELNRFEVKVSILLNLLKFVPKILHIPEIIKKESLSGVFWIYMSINASTGTSIFFFFFLINFFASFSLF